MITKFKVMFPSFCTQLMHDEEMISLMVDEWASALQGIDLNAIGQAIEQLTRSNAKWPPSLPEFVGMCKPSRAAAHQLFLPEMNRPADPEIAKNGLNALKRLVGR